jgi:hypothetical protein
MSIDATLAVCPLALKTIYREWPCSGKCILGLCKHLHRKRIQELRLVYRLGTASLKRHLTCQLNLLYRRILETGHREAQLLQPFDYLLCLGGGERS